MSARTSVLPAPHGGELNVCALSFPPPTFRVSGFRQIAGLHTHAVDCTQVQSAVLRSGSLTCASAPDLTDPTPVPVALCCHRPPGTGTSPRGHGLALAETRSEEHTSELQSLRHLVCRLLL